MHPSNRQIGWPPLPDPPQRRALPTQRPGVPLPRGHLGIGNSNSTRIQGCAPPESAQIRRKPRPWSMPRLLLAPLQTPRHRQAPQMTHLATQESHWFPSHRPLHRSGCEGWNPEGWTNRSSPNHPRCPPAQSGQDCLLCLARTRNRAPHRPKTPGRQGWGDGHPTPKRRDFDSPKGPRPGQSQGPIAIVRL